jgi:cell division protein FtsN
MVNPDRNLYEPPYDDALLYESDLEPERPRSRPLVVLLGIVVLAAFAGVVWVAYNQGVKHGQNGDPPVLSADSGPTRVPADPTAAGETKDVAADKSYERLFNPDAQQQAENILPTAEQPRTAPAEQGPQAPQEIAADVAQGGPSANKATDIPPPVDPRMDATTGVAGPVQLAPGAPQPISSEPPTPLPSSPGESEDITAELPSSQFGTPNLSGPEPLLPERRATPKAGPKTVTVTQLPPSTSAPAIAPAPTKPAPTVAKPAPTTPVPAATKPVADETQVAALSPATEAPARAGGSVMIQLGSFPNDSLAASAWSKIKSANQELLGDYSPMIKPAEIEGKGTWYRLRLGGFADKAAAANVCEQLKATGQACIIAMK